ncbi:hypothetical protein FSP39_009675 [Pinctada imbricata]|uniref:tryptophan--tRNA ligase n=1 Tax=Pinctada imbricata TaxID=66713 RepID=A0AA88Y3V6_PINIB|nr:hypothetical protein FSP39_009675 [Pinctada imbricata]
MIYPLQVVPLKSIIGGATEINDSLSRRCSKFYSQLISMVQSASADTTSKSSPCVFSGIQPTGVPHIGNYLGAIQHWVSLQNQYDDVILSIVDLHSITVPQKPDVLRSNIQILAACLIASGIDPNKSILFQQSDEKSAKIKKASVGLLIYPVLQAADILLYRSDLVPVGEDQLKHIELARDLARFFNNQFGEAFPVPEGYIGNTPKIRNLKDPTSKMSKSDDSSMGYITILDSDDEILQKIKKAKTDFTSQVTYDVKERPGVSNLVEIHAAFTGKTYGEICDEVSDLDTGKYKLHLADIVIDKLRPIRDRANDLLQDKHQLEVILKNGKDRASVRAERTLKDVKRLVGFS